jgi:NhaA family Na+:H+ antiporter
LFYSKDFQLYYFCAALLIFVILYIAGKKRFYLLPAYLLAGAVLWYCMLRSGIHASISGVLLAFAIPFEKEKPNGISYRLQHALHKPVAFIVLPLFALANTSIRIPFPLLPAFSNRNALGIMAGLVAGKLCGIFFSAWLAVKMKIAVLPAGVGWRELLGASLLGGIGFTMSIFITNLAFTDEQVIVSSKMSILLASVFAAILGLFILKMSRAAVTHGGRLS